MVHSVAGIGSKRLVVGAHYGLAGFIAQRMTSIVLTLWIVLVSISALFGPLSYDTWAALFAPLWMKIVTLIAMFSLLYHAWIGMRNIWMDYIQPVWVRLSLETFTVLWLIACGVWSVQILWRV
ncbi:MAG TPA: succinate dehydrogenase, hydrophobic membrane anchor protein [Burkholderiaceae bacterium]|nr:succinate dehydrogenase, hydrophobic membrane anchor protein [Burkholderiaceae bacterium]